MIGSQITAALPVLRSQARSMMLDTVTIDRLDGIVWDEELQKSVANWVQIAADVPANIDMPPATTRALVTDEVVTPGEPVVKVPITVDGVEPDDRVTVTAVSPSGDPELVGAVFWVTYNRNRTTAVSRRLECRWTQ